MRTAESEPFVLELFSRIRRSFYLVIIGSRNRMQTNAGKCAVSPFEARTGIQRPFPRPIATSGTCLRHPQYWWMTRLPVKARHLLDSPIQDPRQRSRPRSLGGHQVGVWQHLVCRTTFRVVAQRTVWRPQQDWPQKRLRLLLQRDEPQPVLDYQICRVV
jgi:hypothetical protein